MDTMGMTDTQFKGFVSFLLDDVEEVYERLEKQTLKDQEGKEKVKKISDKLERIMND